MSATTPCIIMETTCSAALSERWAITFLKTS